MILLVECSSKILNTVGPINGADKISRLIFQLVKTSNVYRIVVVTNLPEDQLTRLSSDKANSITYLNYSMLRTYFNVQKSVPDVAITFGLVINDLATFRMISGFSFPIIGLIHSMGFEQHFSDLLSTKPFLRANDVLICPSKNTQDTVVKAGILKNYTKVMHYGLDVQVYAPSKQPFMLRQAQQIPKDKVVLLVLSRISSSQKMDIAPLIRLMPRLLAINPDVVLYIVGVVMDMGYVDELKMLADKLGVKKSIYWNHQPDHDVIYQYYQLSDIFISLSDYCGETFGLNVMEAMSCELPVVISDFAGYGVHIKDGVEGFYVSTYSLTVKESDTSVIFGDDPFGAVYSQLVAADTDMLVSRLKQLLLSKNLRKKMGDAGRKKVLKNRTLDKMFNRYHHIITSSFNKHQQDQRYVHGVQYCKMMSHLSHQVTFTIKPSYKLLLTDLAIDVLTGRQPLYFFEQQFKDYKLIKVILILLHNKICTVTDLIDQLTVSSAETLKNCLFLIKQGFIIVRRD